MPGDVSGYPVLQNVGVVRSSLSTATAVGVEDAIAGRIPVGGDNTASSYRPFGGGEVKGYYPQRIRTPVRQDTGFYYLTG